MISFGPSAAAAGTSVWSLHLNFKLAQSMRFWVAFFFIRVKLPLMSFAIIATTSNLLRTN
jgi:hypothetical protein